MTTFVSCIFDKITASGLQESQINTYRNLLSKWVETRVFLQLYIKDYFVFDWFERWIAENGSVMEGCIKVDLLEDIYVKEPWARSIELDRCVLPHNRNKEKDTIGHIWNTLHKYPCLSKCARENPFQTEFFAYMDFHAFDLFRDPRTIGYIREHYGQTQSKAHKQLFLEKRKKLFIPGCWGKLESHFVTSAEYKHNIHWRFCGAFVFGHQEAVLKMDKLYQEHFVTYVQQNDKCLSWDVNYWAWLEATMGDLCNIEWYPGDHNDTLIRVPNMFGFHILKHASSQFAHYRYMYPDLSPYRPMSASCVWHNGQCILNTRYVNYWIYDNGGYWYPEDEQKIRTKNVCSLMKYGSEHHDTYYPVCYKEVNDKFEPPIMKQANVFSEGVEDIRLFVSQQTGKLMFIGSTLGYSYADKIRMIVGEYEIHTQETDRVDVLTNEITTLTTVQHANLTRARIVNSPFDSWCEKNWCPIPFGDTEDGFVYQWHPLRIGKLVEGEHSRYDLDIVVTIPTNTEIFGKVKGSTPFRKHGDHELIGMVHSSEEMHPRQYYNRLVILNRYTFEVVRCSESFCFEHVGVEFCMSMESVESKWVFWISQKDRDPMMIEIEHSFFDDKWILF